MALQLSNVVCSNCSANFDQIPKLSFLGFQKFECSSCKKKIYYSLTKGYRIAYWVITVIMIVPILGVFTTGRIGLFSLIGIVSIYALIKDREIQENLSSKSVQ
jgi:hypothetical protein